jgi:hypothetical protein
VISNAQGGSLFASEESEFYRDSGQAVAPLWAELNRLGIELGGIDEAAVEPPPPVDLQTTEQPEIDEVIVPEGASAPEDQTPTRLHHLRRRLLSTAIRRQLRSPCERQILLWRITSRSEVKRAPTRERPVWAPWLCRIIEAEGPIIAKRAYDIYLRGCGIKRLGPELKSQMNRALSNAIRQGKVISENEPRVSGLLFSTIKKQRKSANTRLRCRGPRTFEEIPPAELRAASKLVSETLHLEPGTDEHRQFGIFRLEAANRSGWHNAPGDPRQTGSERYAAL